MSIHGGIESVSQSLSPHGGVAGLDRKIVRAYAGVNGVARMVYQRRVYLFRDGVEDTALTGGWTGSYTHKTNSGSNYSMKRLTNDGTYFSGSMSSTGGSAENCLYIRSLNALDLSKFRKLICVLEWYTSRDNQSSSYPIYAAHFGVFNHAYSNAQSNQIDARYLAQDNSFTPSKNSGYEEITLNVDIDGVASGDILYCNYVANQNSSINIRIKEIWLE